MLNSNISKFKPFNAKLSEENWKIVNYPNDPEIANV